MKYCEEYAALLDLYVDGELPPEELAKVQAHLDTCHGCRTYVDDALAIRAAFPDAEDTPVPENFCDRVLAAIQAEAAPRTEAASPAEAIRQKETSLKEADLQTKTASKRRCKTFWFKAALPLAACLTLVVLAQTGPMENAAAPAAAPAADVCAPETTTAEPEHDTDRSLDDAPAEVQNDLQDEDQETAKQDAAGPGAPQAYTAAATEGLQEPRDSTSNDYRYFAVLTLTEAEAGDLLDGFSPVETDTDRRYELPRADYETLLASLAEADVTIQAEAGNPDTETALVIVTKP